MPKVTAKEIFQCVYCGKEFTSEELAKQHEATHDLIYIAIEREDLNRLLNFLSVHIDPAREMLTERLWKALFKYTKGG